MHFFLETTLEKWWSRNKTRYHDMHYFVHHCTCIVVNSSHLLDEFIL